RIVPVKHLEDVSAIADRLPEVPFTVIGYLPAHGRGYLEQLRRGNRAGNVKFLPNLDEASKREYLSRSKVVVNPSRNDTLVIALLEAMAAGLAPVAHASGGPLEYLEPHQLYRTIDEAVTAVQLALDVPAGPSDLASAERARELLDPARLERELVPAVEHAFVARRR
ncbi:MAG: glycosyltransferase, partial [Thermoplasmata archaeon]|nr:glycosyltransferase [Thermoplasmata archaeon]